VATRVKQSGPTTEKLAISLPRDLAESLRVEVIRRGSPSVSAFIAEVLREKLERDSLKELLDETFAENPMTDDERAWADQYFFGP
jgi:metal-responsive CopG/Arc/MetJ family transcriptional regulator